MLVNDRSEAGRTQNQILHRGSRLLFRYWETLRAERPCPTRQDINLRQLVPILPNIVVIEPDVMTESGWRYRLAGTQACEILKENPTKNSDFFIIQFLALFKANKVYGRKFKLSKYLFNYFINSFLLRNSILIKKTFNN